MLTFSGITDAECTDGVELTVDGQLIFDGTTLYRPVGDSFSVSCRRCSGGGQPKWFDSNEDEIQRCSGTTMICSAKSRNIQKLRFKPFLDSLAGAYKCTQGLNGTITISALG